MLTRHVSGRTYNYEYCIGRQAAGGAGFIIPIDFAVGSNRSLYVVSRGSEFSPSLGITKCTLDHEVIWEDRGLTFAGGQSPWPNSVDIDSEESVFISDDYTGRISVYDRDGNYQGTWGTKGSGDGELNSPRGLPSMQRTTSLSWTVSTAASRSSPERASYWTSGAATAVARASSTCPGECP